jgi:lipopolysaccharide/colanic/teichoic acid biosynthesis glycosyltransferase
MAGSVAARNRTPSLEYVLDDREAIRSLPIPAWKRAIDVAGSVTGLLVGAPIFVALALYIMLDSRGGPLFRQTRVGIGGRCFTCWKFRSMHRNADQMLEGLLAQNEASGPIFKMKDDPRRTRAGRLLRKTSLDELPQLWNVLRGDMSLVGPRPPTVPEVLRYDEHHLARLTVTPGLTGLWQVTLRGRHDFSDMVELDVEYANRRSLALDLRIMIMTVPTVVFGRGSC